MKHSIIIFFLFLASCHPSKQLYKTYELEDSKGFLNDISSEVVELNKQGTIDGLIVELSTQERIIGASILLHNRDVMLGTISGKNGRFQLENIPEDSYRLIVGLVGYHTLIDTISISSKEFRTFKVELIESPVELGSNY